MADARAGRAHAARLDAAARAAIERAREFDGEEFLAQALLAREQERARHTPLTKHPPQSLLRALVTDELVEHKRRGQRLEVRGQRSQLTRACDALQSEKVDESKAGPNL